MIGRLPRVVPEPGATFNGYFVPGGTIIGMSSWFMHRNPDIFPEPMKFDPERWLNPENARMLERSIRTREYNVCGHAVSTLRNPLPPLFLSQTAHTYVRRLAYCELYITLGTLFRRFRDLKVFLRRRRTKWITTTSSLHSMLQERTGSRHIRRRTWPVETPLYHKLIFDMLG
jgi:cytochrome P450